MLRFERKMSKRVREYWNLSMLNDNERILRERRGRERYRETYREKDRGSDGERREREERR